MIGGTFSFVDVAMSLAGPTGGLSMGYGNAVSDEGITITPVGEKNTMHTGADGSVQHSLHAETSAIVTIRYLKVSPLNALLQAMYDLQTSSSALHGQNTITVTHLVSGDIHTCQFCAFKKKPEIKYAKEADLLEWTFDAGSAVSILGTY